MKSLSMNPRDPRLSVEKTKCLFMYDACTKATKMLTTKEFLETTIVRSSH